MNKSPKQDIKSMNAGSRMGAFDKALKNPYNSDIVSRNGEGFSIQYPFGIMTIVPTREAVRKFIDIAKEYGMDEYDNESIFNCCADKDELEKGGRINWESERYSDRMKNKIKLGDWIRGDISDIKKPEPSLTIVKDDRERTQQLLEPTGTNGA